MSALTTAVSWLVTAMMAWSPVTRPHFIPEAKESEAAATQRYNEIAEAIVGVTYDAANPSVVQTSGGHSRAGTSMLLLSIAFFESGFRRDVDLGLGKYGRGDFGRSHCMMQVLLGKNHNDRSVLKKLIGKDWSPDDLVQDRSKCFTTGYILVSKSFNACKHLPLQKRLAAYASGSCDKGYDESVLRVGRALRWYTGHPPTFKDADVLEDLKALRAKTVTHGTNGT